MMKKYFLFFMVMLVSSNVLHSREYSGTRFWLQSYEDVILLKNLSKVDVKLEDIEVERGFLGKGHAYFQVCVGYKYVVGKIERNQEYYYNMPRLTHRYKARHSAEDPLGCDISLPEVDLKM